MSNYVKQFFAELEAIWDAVPGYVKVFIYSTVSSVFGLWVAGQIDVKSVIIIVATNLGIYQIPKIVVSQTNKYLE